MKRRNFLTTGAAFACAPLLSPGRAAAQTPQPITASWPFFAFDNGVGRGKWPPERQADTLKALGYDGISYNYTNNADLRAWLRIYPAAGLSIYALYLPLTPEKMPAWSPALEEAVQMLKGSATVLWVTIPAPKTRSPEGYDAPTADTLRAFGDLAQKAGLRVAIYPHVGCHVATASDALRVAKQTAHPAVRPSYNLCHEFLTGNGGKAMETLRAAAPEAALISINGVDPDDSKRYILPLGRGAFDTAAFLAELKRLGYRGPVGHQFYNIPGDPEKNLKTAIDAWRKQQPL